MEETVTLTKAEAIALAELVNKHIGNVPDSEISDDLRSAAAKIEAVTTNA